MDTEMIPGKQGSEKNDNQSLQQKLHESSLELEMLARKKAQKAEALNKIEAELEELKKLAGGNKHSMWRLRE